MSVAGNNATSPSPAIAPGAEAINTRAVAESIGAGTWRWAGAGTGSTIDPRIRALVPGFDAPFFQAGLAGYSDAAMRLIARDHGCPFCVTEALLDRTLLAGGRGFDKADLGELHDNVPGGTADQPLAGQIMGSEPREMAAAALKMTEQRARTDKEYRLLAYADGQHATSQVLRMPGGEVVGRFDPSEELGDGCDEGESCDPLDTPLPEENDSDTSTLSSRLSHASPLSFQVIDVNLACPVKKIESKSRGGHWLTDPRGAIKLLEAVRHAVPAHIPCTVKLRRSFDDTPEMVENFHAIFDASYRIGYAWATVHARTVEQKYVGPSRWTFLRELRERHRDRVFFGSGDVWDAHDIFRMIRYAGVSGVSVARGCIGNPWIFRQARDMMRGQQPRPPTLAEQRDVLERHFRLSLACTRRFRRPEEATSRMMRKFAIRFSQHHPRADEVRRAFIAVSSASQWRDVLNRYYQATET